MKKTNFTLLSNSLKISIFLMLCGFYSNFSHAQCPPFNFNDMIIEEPGVLCGDLGPNLLANPGFEAQQIPAGSELFTEAGFTPLSGWNSIGVGNFGWGTNMIIQNNFQTSARTGNNHLKMFFDGPQFYQDFPAAPGDVFAASIYMQHVSIDAITAGNSSELHIEYRDADGCLIAFDSYSSSIPVNIGTTQDVWLKYTTVSEAPATTATVRFTTLHFNPSGGGAVFYDDASLQQVTGATSLTITGGTADDLCMASVVVPPLDGLFEVGGLFGPFTFTNDFNGGTDASGDYRFGTTVVNVIATNANGQESAPCAIEVVVEGAGTSSILACNDNVTVSLDSDGCSLVNADMILEGSSFGCFDQYQLTRSPAHDGSCGDTPFEGQVWVNCEDVGQTIVIKVTDPTSGNSCWGSVVVEDKGAPEIVCDGPFVIDCTQDPASLGLPVATDNCENLTPFVVSQEEVGADCGIKTLTITYQAADSHGNLSDHCERVITVNPTSAIGFPDDIEWSCEQYGLYPNITEATAVNPLINVANACAETNRNNRLRLTGSGVPDVMGLNNTVCRFNVTHSDQILESCQGVSTDIVFKLLRTWTVLNWCSGVITTETQIVKVSDKDAPELDLSGVSNSYYINQTSGNATHGSCGFSGPIGVPTITDNCSGVGNLILEVWTDADQFVAYGQPITDANGNVTGFTIPEPYLNAGVPYLFYYTASDLCGNKNERVDGAIAVSIIDNSPPAAVCRELTQISLNSYDNGISDILAEHFNEASYDNCGPVHFKVRKMELGTCDDANIDKDEEVNYLRGIFCNINDPQEWFDDDVKFCCEEVGTTVNVILRVYDRNPVCNDWSSVPTLEDAAGTHFDPPCYPVCDLGGVTTEGLSAVNRYYNDCMIEVVVEDKSRPQCTSPADLWLTCLDVPENVDWDDEDFVNGLYGSASAYDNCDATVETISVNVNLDDCGIGTIIRGFRAIDSHGNTSITTAGTSSSGVNPCRQTIMVQAVNSYCVTLPADFEDECRNGNAPSDLTFTEAGCDLLSIGVEEIELLAGGSVDECKKLVRTWTIINWCEYDGLSAATPMPRADFAAFWRGQDREFCSDGTTIASTDPRLVVSYPSTGFYTYDQHVKIYDNTAPVISYDGDVDFCGGDLDQVICTGQVDISIDIDDACTNSITTTWELDVDNDVFAEANLTGSGPSFGGRYPLGTHTIRFLVADDCGNVSFEDVTFNVIDCKAPTPVCFNGLSVELMPTGMVCVWASDFDASSFDYCHDFELTANVVTDKVRDGVINSADYETTRPLTDTVKLTCDNLDQTTFVQLWVHELSGDGVNDDDYCVATIEVQDNPLFESCAGSRTAIVGTVKDESGEDIENATVTISGDMASTFTTDDSGAYSFTVGEGNDYSVATTKNDDVRNGVSTFDLALISKHVLNVESLNSPYKVIAADANNSGSVTTLDLVAIRKVILFITNEFPNNSSWRFIDKDYIFPNTRNPFAGVIPELKSFNNVSDVNIADFVGVKIGDVSGDASANGLSSIEDRTLNRTFFLNAEDKSFQSGEEVRVTVNADHKSINGYQATINFNTKSLELVEIEGATLSKEHFGTIMTDEGIVTLSWNGVAETNEAFTLVFTAKNNSRLSDELSISSLYTQAEAYNGNEVMNVNLNFGNVTSESSFALHQNTPNPFKAETVIGFEMPQADAATLTISDLSGKMLRVIRGNYEAGYNSINVEMTNNLPMGVLIYELETSTHKATRKMTIVK